MPFDFGRSPRWSRLCTVSVSPRKKDIFLDQRGGMDTPSRRQLLATGTVALLSASGCLGLGNSSGDAEPESSGNPAEDGTEDTPANRTETTVERTVTATPADPELPSELASSWPLPSYSTGRSGHTPETAGPTSDVSELWTVDIDEPLSTPVIVDEQLYVVGESGTVHALDARTGTGEWTVSVDPVGRTIGVLDGRLWVRTGNTLVSLDKDGTPLWQVDSHDYRVGDVAPHGVYYLERRYGTTLAVGADLSGEIRWRADLVSQEREEILAGPENVYAVSGPEWEYHALGVDTGGSETVEVAGGSPKALTAHDGELFYADREGNLYGPRWWLELGGFGVSAPRVGPDAVFVFVRDDENRGVHAFDRATGGRNWQTEGGDVRDFVVTTASVIACTTTKLVALDAADGSKRWETTFPERRQPALSVVDDLVYMSHSDGIVAYREP